MRNSVISMGTIALLILGSTAGWAGNLSVPNTFVSGTKAVAADVNANFDAVATEVNDNDTRITTNAADIATNASAIATKANAADVTANAAAINANATAIGTKADAATVTANTADIATNTGNISTNNSAISTNAGNISSNAARITVNEADIADLQKGNKTGIPCAGNDPTDIMVRVGPLCVDKYEASVWSKADGSSDVTAQQLGDAGDNYSDGSVASITCNDHGNDCTGNSTIYARSEAGVSPSAFITWFQAQQACAASGKRLLTNAEWQMAAAGTVEANCNISGGVTGNTDANPSCVSNWGVVNMVGNVNEWVADWIQGATTTTIIADEGGVVDNISFDVPKYTTGSLGSDFGNDTTAGVQQADSTNFPAAVYRGGGSNAGGVFQFIANHAPSYSISVIGFRCAR